MAIRKFFYKNENIEEDSSFQNWLNIKEINKKVIKLNTGQSVVILKVLPINFNLKSQLEQTAILNSYKLFLKNLNSDTQIVISSKKTNVSNHLNEILKNTKENPLIHEMSKDYIQLINDIVEQKGTITKDFFIVINASDNMQNDILKITEYLNSCGNFVEECTKDEIKSLLRNFINKRLLNNVSYI